MFEDVCVPCSDQFCFDEGEWVKIAKQFDFNPYRETEHIGAGYYADVYDIGRGRVLKITRDPSDFKMAEKIRKEPLFGFVRIYDVCRVAGYKCIVAEKMARPIKSDETWCEFIKTTTRHGKRDPVQNWLFWMDKASDEDREFYKVQIGWLEMVAEQCLDRNYAFADLHSDNVMLDAQGCAYITDMGCAYSNWDDAYRDDRDWSDYHD